MVCSFCGTDNRPENRFCGICGVRLERRKMERREHQDGSYLKCPSCDNVNDPGYKFCGMCGGRIDRRLGDRRGRVGAGAEPGATATANVVLPTPEAPARRKPEQRTTLTQERASEVLPHPATPATIFRSSEPGGGSSIGGPSFLGLSDEPENDGSYLLEDESSSRGGLRKLVLLVILAAILGLIFVQWRSSIRANPKSSEPTPTATPAPPQGQNQPGPATPAQPASAQTSQSSDAAKGPSAEPSPSPGESQRSTASAKAEKSPFVDVSAADAAPDKSGLAADKTDAPDTKDTKDEHSKALETVIPAEQKPSNTLLRAQQFLQGKGVSQNCEQGLVYLRVAAQKNEPAAAVQMGALYASGHCVHQDRVMAYRWFNSAHELQPGNTWIQRNMDHLWGQMTEQERRLAGY